MSSYQFEKLSEQISVAISPEHKFGTDAFLLSHFAAARRRDVVCDLGTGCGIIPMLLVRDAAPKQIHAVDIQEKAIEQFAVSIAENGLEDRVVPHLADLKDLSGVLPGNAFDLVTCNPPYKASRAGILSELTAEQIARHEVLCTIYDICRTASKLLKFGGRLCICQRPERLCDVIDAMKQADLEPKRLRFVAKEPAKEPWLFLIEGKKGSRPFLTVEPMLSVYEGEAFSDEMAAIYGWGRESGK